MDSIKTEHLPHYNYDDYKMWERNWELINGIPYAMSHAPTISHQRINGNIYALARQALKNCNKCEALLPINWKVNDNSVVQPDISIINYAFEKGPFITEAPVVIFEILSHYTVQKDQFVKKELYENAGVKYYVIIHPLKNFAEIFQLVNSKYEKIKEITEEAFEFDLKDEADFSFSLNFKEIW